MPKGIHNNPDCQCYICKSKRGEQFGKNNSFYGKRHSEKSKKKISKNRTGKCMGKDNPNHNGLSKEHRQKLSENHADFSGKNHPHYGKNLFEIHKSNCSCPWCGAKRGEQKGEKRPEHSKQLKKLWQTSEYVQNQMKARGVRPNKPELFLNSLLQQLLPNEYKYVGDGEFILAGKCPDFINVNGQKKIIEFFGDYWHKGDTGEDRINLFKQYGYETLIIWEKELENKELLEDKVLQFNNI